MPNSICECILSHVHWKSPERACGRNAENTLSDLYFNEESYYSEEKTTDNEDFCYTIFEPFQFEPERVVMRAMRK